MIRRIDKIIGGYFDKENSTNKTIYEERKITIPTETK